MKNAFSIIVFRLPVFVTSITMLSCTLFFCSCNRQQSQNDGDANGEKSVAEIPGEDNASNDGSTTGRVAQTGFTSTSDRNDVDNQQMDNTVERLLKDKLKADDAISLTNQLDTLTSQAKALESNGQFGAAVQAWQRVRRVLASRFPEDSWQVANADVSTDLARVISKFTPLEFRQFQELGQLKSQLEYQVNQNEIQLALNTSKQCEHMVIALLGVGSVWNGKMQQQIGELLFRQRNWDAAIARQKTAIKLFDARYPSEHPDIEKSAELISMSLRASNRLDQAIEVQRDLVEMTRNIWGDSSLECATRLNDLGTLQHTLKMLDQAEQSLATADTIRMTMLGPNHLDRAVTLRNRAVVALDKKQFSSANEMFRHAKDIFVSELGATHQWSIDASKKLAVVYLMQKENEKAESELIFVKDAVFQSLGDQNVDYADACFELAIALGNQGKFETARPLLEHAANVHQTQLGDQNQKTQQTKSILATINQRLNSRKQNR